ncbi:VCBS domain-containing protein, partial [Larsenimonas rhizosphaerae]|uniref:VCBS domain-containing protein n=1 Tax=Larsenimonas rhizosphaerae TaxID=2944682 RepID=UPI0020345A36
MANITIERIDGALFTVDPRQVIISGASVETGSLLFAPDGARMVLADGTVLDVAAGQKVLLSLVDGTTVLEAQDIINPSIPGGDSDVAELLAAIARGDDPTLVQEGPAAGAEAGGDTGGGEEGGFSQPFGISREGREEAATYTYAADNGSSATITERDAGNAPVENADDAVADTGADDTENTDDTFVEIGADNTENTGPSIPVLSLDPLVEDSVVAGQRIGTASSTAANGGPVAYALSDNGAGYLAIDSVTGDITLTQAGVDAINNDDLNLDNLSITVTATDVNANTSSANDNITVVRTDDPATISGVQTGDVAEDTVLTTSGTLSVSDPDAGESTFVAQPNTTGAYGNFAIDEAGNWAYMLDNTNGDVQALGDGNTLTETFTVITAGGDRETVTVTINGTDDAAEITGVQT